LVGRPRRDLAKPAHERTTPPQTLRTFPPTHRPHVPPRTRCARRRRDTPGRSRGLRKLPPLHGQNQTTRRETSIRCLKERERVHSNLLFESKSRLRRRDHAPRTCPDSISSRPVPLSSDETRRRATACMGVCRRVHRSEPTDRRAALTRTQRQTDLVLRPRVAQRHAAAGCASALDFLNSCSTG